MTIIVQKFGGTSVANTDKIIAAAKKVVAAIADGFKPVVVVSAMAGATNQLISYCLEIAKIDDYRQKADYDAVLCNGENITAALMSLALNSLGQEAQSLQGFQVPINTDNNYTISSILSVNPEIIQKLLAQNIIPVITGFQGFAPEGRITTLGRGGSDITAVAIAASLKAERCDIYTDVNGVFSADPRFVSNSKKRNFINYDDMLEFSILGAKVLHHRSVEIAMRYNVIIRILSSFENLAGTIISKKLPKEILMEQTQITGIAYNDKIVLLKITEFGGDITNKIIQILLNANINIVSILSCNKELSLIIPLTDFIVTKQIFELNEIKYIAETTLALISIVGIGINNDLKVLSIITNIMLKMNYLNVAATKISFVIDLESLESSVKSLHRELINFL